MEAKCGCYTKYADSRLAFEYCALHAAAHDMLEALIHEHAANRVILEVLREAYDRFTDSDMVPANYTLKTWLAKARICFEHGSSEQTQVAIAKAQGRI